MTENQIERLITVLAEHALYTKYMYLTLDYLAFIVTFGILFFIVGKWSKII